MQDDDAEAAANLGLAWVYLGWLRLRLLRPEPGIDPASEPYLERERILHEKEAWLLIEKQVRAGAFSCVSPLLGPETLLMILKAHILTLQQVVFIGDRPSYNLRPL